MMMFTLLLILCGSLQAVLAAHSSSTSRGFVSLVVSLQDDTSVDMEEVMDSEELYLAGHKEDVLYSEVELLTGEEEELPDELEEGDGAEDNSEPDISDLPEELDLRAKGILHPAIYQGGCGSCGWVSGTQTLEARIALVSENYIPYSIQNFMNCAGRPCVGAQPYTVTTQAKKSGMIVPEQEIPYTKKKCVKESEKGKQACYAKCGAKHPDTFTNALHEQFVIIGGTRSARSDAQLMAALQEGPVTTCFTRRGRRKGEKCAHGWAHANSIIGYTKEAYILQESIGAKWGPFQNGSWITAKGSVCSHAIIKKAYYPKIYYDYDRANAYYTKIEGGVEELELVEKEKYGITVNDTRNWGTAKNKCAFLGAACQGVVALLPSGPYELVSQFGAGAGEGGGAAGGTVGGGAAAFRKTQMVVYLKHEATGKYLAIRRKRKKLQLVATADKGQAAPFFTSYARFISFQHPTHHLVDNTLQPLPGDVVRDVDVMQSWTLNNCNIHNTASGNSFDLVQGKKQKTYLGGGSAGPDITLPEVQHRPLWQVAAHVKQTCSPSGVP